MSIINFLEEQKIDTQTVNPRKKEGLDFLETFFNQNADELSTLTNNSLNALATAYFVSLSPENLENCKYITSHFNSLFTKHNLEVLRILLYLSTDKEFLNAYYSSGLNISILHGVTSAISSKYEFEAKSAIKFIGRFFFRLDDFRAFVDFFRNISFTTRNANELCIILYTALDVQSVRQTFGDGDLTTKALQKTEKKIGRINESYLFLRSNYYERKREYGKEVREVNKYNNILQNAIATLERNPNYVRSDALDKLLSLHIDNRIKHTIIDYIYSINSKVEESIAKSYEQAKTSSKEMLKEMLTSYNIDYKSLSKEEIASLKNISSLKLKQILEFFFKFQIHIDSIARLAYIDVDIIEEISRLLQNGVLTPKFVGENLNILENNSAVYRLISSNLGLLSSMEINIRNYPDSLDILLTDLTYNLRLLSMYKINITNRTKDISFLATSDLEAKLDLLLETEYDLNNMQSYDLLNYSLGELYASILASSLDIEYTKDTFGYFAGESLMPKCSLLIPEELLATFQNNTMVSKLPDLLEKYKVGPNVLVINGVYVSINRLQRNLSCIDPINPDELLYAILYKGYYNLAQVNLLKEEIQTINRGL